LSGLAVEDRVAASTQNQALAALTFLYDRVLQRPLTRIEGIAPARQSRHVPVVLTPAEVRAILAKLDEPARLCAALMYGSGLRLHECLTLRIKDVDFGRREIVVRDGKGGKDRRTPLADRCAAPLKRRFEHESDRARRDRRLDVHTTELPPSLVRKFPTIETEYRWRYVFAATRTFTDSAGLRRRRGTARIQECGARRECHEASDVSLPSALVRDSSSGIRSGHSDGTGAVGPCGRTHDDDLHARSQSWRLGSSEPSGRAVRLRESGSTILWRVPRVTLRGLAA
jgi:integrase